MQIRCRSGLCRLSVRFSRRPPGRTRRRLGVLAVAYADAPAPAGPAPVGWRGRRNAGRSTRSKFHLCMRVVPAPAARLSGAGQNPSRPSVAAGQPRLSSCLVNVHAKTALSRTCPDQELAAIGSRDTSGQGR
jgi:hypothetical protein